jgi:hypothetical protein
MKRARGLARIPVLFLAVVALGRAATSPTAAAAPTLTIDTPMPAPEWARLERQLLAENVPACREFAQKYYDDRGYLQCFIRWGANDGPDDAFENFVGWPELHALGGSDELLQTFLKTWNGMIRQYSEAKTVDVPAGRHGMYVKEFSAQADWMHHGEGLRTFNKMGLSVPTLPIYQERARRFAGFYMAEDPTAPNYDPQRKLIRSMLNGSIGPMLRPATALDWVGDPFDVAQFVAGHGEHTFAQFLRHYEEYGDVVGDHFLNLVATTLPLDAYLLANEPKYKAWIVDYMDAWLERMRANGGIIPSFVDLDGKVGGPENKWWGNAYGWGFSPLNPVTGRREDRNRIPRALIGFNNALLVTGDQKYVDAWRAMMDAVNSHARTTSDGRKEYPTMYGANGWYGWTPRPWNVGALEIWYWSMKPADRARVPANEWVAFLEGRAAGFPEQALRRDLQGIGQKLAALRADRKPPEKRLADNMMDFNPAAPNALMQLMWGAPIPGRDGGLINARLRYFDPVRRRAGVPEDVGALVSEFTDTTTVVTLVNLSATERRQVIVQAGAYGEHQFTSASVNGKTSALDGRDFAVELAPAAGAKIVLTQRRYVNAPTVRFPWDR